MYSMVIESPVSLYNLRVPTWTALTLHLSEQLEQNMDPETVRLKLFILSAFQVVPVCQRYIIPAM